MRNHRLQRGVIEAAKRCKAGAEKASCLSKGVPSAAKADDLAAAYDAIAKTFARSDDPQIPGKIREDKVLAVSTFLVDACHFCKADAKCWGDMLPSSESCNPREEPARGREALKHVIAKNLSKTYYDASILVQKTVECRSTFNTCDAMRSEWRQGRV